MVRGERDRGCTAVLPCPSFFLQIFTELQRASSTVCVCVCVCWTNGRHLADACVGRMLNEQMNGRRNQRYWRSMATQPFLPQ